MSEHVLTQFRNPAETLSQRKKVGLVIQTDRGTVRGSFDPLFKTVTTCGLTVPEKELHFWMKAAHGAKVLNVITEGAP